MKPSELSELDRIVELDGVRGFALMMVLWIHCFLLKPTNGLAKLANSIGGSMFISIDLFFVLSGFLITGILIRTRDSSQRGRNFYARRFLRIFPAYYFVLVFVFFVYPLFYAPVQEAPLEREAAYYFLYVQNFLFAWRGEGAAWPGLDHLWSMAIEEQFYLLWPLVVWRTPPEKLARLCACIVGVAVVFKLGILAAGASNHQVFLPTYSRLEGVTTGAGLAAMWQIHGIRRTPAWLRTLGIAATVCLLVLIFQTHKTKLASAPNIVAHTIAATFAFAWMLYTCITAPRDAIIRRFFRSRALIFLGTYSYGIYLLHWVVYWQTKYFVLGALESRIGINAASTIAGITVISITIVLALVMYRVIEEPALRLKRFFSSPRPRRAAAAAVLLALVAASGTADAATANPTITPAPAGIRGYPLWDSWWDLSEVGYEEQELFVSGTAESVERPTSAPYTTRIIVTRPSDPERWNGAVLLDWVNVTAQFENPVDTLEARELLLREGWAWVHVSAQAAGLGPVPLLTPKTWDPVRYAAISHPGDEFADDIFSQVAQAVKSPVGIDPLGGLPGPRRLIAAGQSQSAARLDRYVRGEHRTAGVIDAFLIHGGGSKDHGAEGPASPVLHLLSDREATRANPTSANNYRLWEIAGTAHSDFWIGYAQVLGSGPRWLGLPKRSYADARELDRAAGNYGEQLHPLHAVCVVAGAAFPMRYAVSAALHHLNRWVVDGTPPPAGPRFRFSGTSLARDADGNALGGIRLPPIDVPVARYVSTACELGGVTIPFTELELLLRYPTHAAYYARMKKRTSAAVAAGFLLPEDASDLLSRACAARNRWLDLGGGSCE